jgi:O-antigen ligase
MKALRIGICLILAFSVLAFGAVEVWSESLLELAAALLFVAWAFLAYRNPDLKIRWNPLGGPLLAFWGIGLLQLSFKGTAYPFLTQTELVRLAAYGLMFFLVSQAFRSRGELSQLAWFVVGLCFLVSLLGIIQYFTSDNELYWIHDLKVRGEPFGPFVNRNHFAGFLELTLPLGLALMIFRAVRRDLFLFTTLLTIVPISAIVLSGSRGGIVGFAFEIGVITLLARSSRARHGASSRVMAIGVLALAALALVTWVGAGRAIERFSKVSSHELSSNRRVSMFRGAAHIFLDHPLKGSGLGTLVDVFPRYETAYDGKLIDHVHNDYIEGLAETGLLGGLCGLAFLWLLYREARKNFTAEQGHFSRALHAGAIAAVCGLLLHSLVDFNLHIPSNALFFLVQAYLATSPALASNGPPPRQRNGAAEFAATAQRETRRRR